MRFFADLHIHSKYSRATSKNCDLENLTLWGRKKGITVIGTGDFTHPGWMAEIKEKYKKDAAKMQKEMTALYKKHKVNPLGGCLPMLLQIPVFIALYNVLLQAIELRGAPFIFWITDLAVKDPYYILPVVMGATMVLQQKMTPSTADKAQQKMMMFMPVVFTFLFLSFPSGLVLYWLVNNVLAIGQQYYINKTAT